eukprot:TRINITY_DN42175_c0_g1_i1.p1 TRINITY_DN42175_c0_g1~~TRINITY_DN42175_c0_g1_i1.p1  ORF type:complete len:265 (+),score=25.46 TRINITY_DN42175_c0_g1_i1:28-795(+)
MGGCKSKVAVAVRSPSSPGYLPPLTQKVAKLRDLVPAEEIETIKARGESLTVQEEASHLTAFLNSRPARIVVSGLDGEVLAEVSLSVAESCAEVERSVFASGFVDPAAFTITMTHNEAVMTNDLYLFDVGILPDQVAAVSLVKNPKPKRNPALDRALFEEAWHGCGHLDKIQALLNNGADPNGYTFSDGDRAIHVTAGRGYVRVVQALCAARADVNVAGVYGLTPLQRCTQSSTTYWKGRFPEVAQILRDHGARR